MVEPFYNGGRMVDEGFRFVKPFFMEN